MDLLLVSLFALLHQVGASVSTSSLQTGSGESYSAATASSGDSVLHTGNTGTHRGMNHGPNIHHIPTADEIFKKNAAIAEDMARKHQEAMTKQHEDVRKHQEAITKQHEDVRKHHEAAMSHEANTKHQETVASKMHVETNTIDLDTDSFHQMEDFKDPQAEVISATDVKDDVVSAQLSSVTENKGQQPNPSEENGSTKRTGRSSYSHSSSSSSSTSSDGKQQFTSSSMTSDPDGVKHTWHSSDDPDHVYTWTDRTQESVESCDESAGACTSATASASASSTNGKGTFQASTMTSGPHGVKHTFHSSDEPDKVYVWTDKN
ncbi:A-agglutinin anchorage subunit-like [Gigantopelta aegis]|uniref:A-agglutinin anchorage subunit-like n=1 Tax=Gigantopelta aegis TaxID=1735272 RepID=UPI001B88E440|nr:A-agglutinin anchorage subunit-like [Gigantopelta aegis]XP_041360976.1 A-agglutinin anchorage subunit-like [Gigantopelta aegis]XP_041360978.1 A-agglutinin anchorage subunit-like [Gigantopelta aegis]